MGIRYGKYSNKPKGQRRAKPGRPPGIHTKHRTPQERRQYLVEKYGSPVEFMMMIMANGKERKERRDKMAINAAPYVEAKMSSVELTGDPEKPVHVVQDLSKLTDAQLAALYKDRVAGRKQ